MMEFIVWHDGKNWIAENDLLNAQATTLKGLDNELIKLLKKKGCLGEGERLDMFMAFDTSTIPRWMHQYSQHYFDRIVEVTN